MQKPAPQNSEAEAAVLGGLLVAGDKPAWIARIFNFLKPGDFYRLQNELVFRALKRDFERHGGIDVVRVKTLALEIAEGEQKRYHNTSANGEYFAALLESVPSAANLEHYAEEIKKAWALRQLSQNARQAEMRCLKRGALAEEIYSDFDREARQILVEARQDDPAFASVESEKIMERIESGQEKPRLMTGLQTLDYAVKLYPGNTYVIAGREGAGKTSFALELARGVSVDREKRTILFSLEMGAGEVSEKLLSRVSEVSIFKIQQGNPDQEELKRLKEAADRLKNSGDRLRIEDSGGVTAENIRNICLEQKAEKGLDFVIVDYVQLIRCPHRDTRNNEIGDISRSLKCLAKELNIPILLLSQCNKSMETRDDKRPRTGDLRDSNCLAQDASTVAFLWRPQESNENFIELAITKQRFGRCGSIPFNFYGFCGKFSAAR